MLQDVKILLVRDEEDLVWSDIKHTLCAEGAEVLVSFDRLDAFQNISEHSIDIILFDFNMRSITPFVFVDGLMELNPNIKLLAMTSHPSKHTKLMAVEMGYGSLLAKSAPPERLLDEVLHLLDRQTYSMIEAIPKGSEKPKVLIVDDDDLVLFSVKEALSKTCLTTTASTSPDAVEILKKDIHDILLTDINMDDMDGVELIVEAKKIQPQLLPIIMTGFPQMSSVIPAFKSGAFDYLLKPLDLELLRNAIAKGWDQQRLSEHRYKLFNELQQTHYELETKIDEVRIANEGMKAANAAKNQFLANMSHEIRTPMNGVITMIELLAHTELSEKQQIYANTVHTSANALLGVINDILDFSKIEADKLELELIDFDLRITVQDIVTLLSEPAKAKGLELTWTIDPQVPKKLRGDPTRLRQIVLNLVGNAIKFTKKGGIHISIELIEDGDETLKLRFNVKDTGIGISADKLESLFQPFVQADSSMTRRYGGTGLGLSISKKLVKFMNGKIGAESKQGNGSSFWFTAQLEKSPNESGQTAGSVPDSIKGSKALVIEHKSNHRKRVCESLDLWECRYEVTDDALNAMVLLKTAAEAQDPFAFAIIDMQLLSMDASDLGKLIKSNETLEETSLIAMTDEGAIGDGKRLEEIGFAGYLKKTVDQYFLYDCLGMIIEKNNLNNDEKQPSMLTKHSVVESQRDRFLILVAEDNMTNQIVAKELLSTMGYRFDIVANGSEALKSLETTPYDLVLMDIQMPVMDGFLATRCIRAQNSAVLRRNIPVIAMTAHAMKGNREECLAAGMDDYIAKPINGHELSQLLDHWLHKKEIVRPTL